MKADEIQVGGTYHDGKQGVREVVAIDGAALRVTYRILAAKVEQEYSYAERRMVSLVGTDAGCDLASFARWAKVRVPDAERGVLLADLALKKVRLAPGETAFMASIADEFKDGEFSPRAGASVSLPFNETRSARSVERKGLLSVSAQGGEVTLTLLGARWIAARLQVAA